MRREDGGEMTDSPHLVCDLTDSLSRQVHRDSFTLSSVLLP